MKTPITQVIQIVLERPQSRRLVMWGSAARVPFPVNPWYQHSGRPPLHLDPAASLCGDCLPRNNSRRK